MKFKHIIATFVIALGLAGASLLVPAWRIKILGHLHHERFIAGMPMSYWESETKTAAQAIKDQNGFAPSGPLKLPSGAGLDRASAIPDAVLVEYLSGPVGEEASRVLRTRGAAIARIAPELVVLLGAQHAAVRLHAAEVLGAATTLEKPAVVALFDLACSGTWADNQFLTSPESYEAGVSLAKVGPSAVPVLLDAAGTPDKTKHFLGIEILAQIVSGHGAAMIGPESVPVLVRAMEYVPPGKEWNIFEAEHVLNILERMGPNARAAAPAIVSKFPLYSNHPSFDPSARKALLAIGRDALPAIMPKLKDSDPKVRFAAAKLVWELDPTSNAIIPTLVGILADGRVKDPGFEGITTQEQDYPQPRPDAEKLLVEIAKHDPAVVPAVAALLNPAWDWRSRLSGARVLGLVGPAAKPAVPDLIRVLQHPDEYRHAVEAAAHAITQIDPNNPALAAWLAEEKNRILQRTR